jgi:GPH family glycoside/pentoside/hexuronide:cation symporter
MKTSHKLWYGIAPFGAQISLRLLEMAPIYLYVTAFLLQGLFAGIAAGLGKVAIMVSQFTAGYTSDRTKSKRLGRRKPFILVGTPLLALSLIMLFMPMYFLTAGDQMPLFLYMTLWVCMANFWYGWFSTPYSSWLPELTEPEERTGVSAILNTTNMIGNAVGFIIAFLLPPLIIAGAWSTVLTLTIVIGLMQILFYLPALKTLIEPPEKRLEISSLRRELSVVTGNHNYLWYLLATGLISVSIISIQALVLGFVQNVLLFTNFTDYALFGGVFVIIIIFSFIIWRKAAGSSRKGKSLTVAMILLALTLPISRFIGPGIPLPLDVQGYLYVGFAAVGLSGFALITIVIISDIAQEDEIRTGEARAGMYMGFNSIPLNTFQVFGFILAGIFQDKTIFPPNAVEGLRWFGPVLAIFIVLGTLVLQKVRCDTDFAKLEKEYASKSKK